MVSEPSTSPDKLTGIITETNNDDTPLHHYWGAQAPVTKSHTWTTPRVSQGGAGNLLPPPSPAFRVGLVDSVQLDATLTPLIIHTQRTPLL